MTRLRSGRSRSSAVLGLCSYTHDSAAALIVDDHLVGFAEEERLTGDKHTKAYPAQTVNWLLAETGLAPEQITAVGYNFQPHRYLAALAQFPGHLFHSACRPRAVARARSFVRVAHLTYARIRELSVRFPQARIGSVQHHRAHGLYAFVSSGYQGAAVLVADSLGEVQSTTISYICRTNAGGCKHQVVEAISDPASLGYIYGAVTEHLGWRRGDGEGTVMALAAFGDPARFRSFFRQAVPITDNGFALDPTLFPLRVLSSRYARISPEFAASTCPPRQAGEPVQQIHRDLAAGLQERTEQILLHLARRARRITGSGLLCVGGGVAANCAAIGKIVDAGLFDEVHVPPAPGDSGTATGAAISQYLGASGMLPTGVEDRCYLGPAYPELMLSETPRPGLRAHRPANPARFLARHLAEGRIVGLFRGCLEAGPRALGNRSILASPVLPDVVDRLNATVKFREPFRPFAPVVLASSATSYFMLAQPAFYMSIAARVTNLTRVTIPAVVHTNGTARVQTLTVEQNPFLAEVLGEFAVLTGIPVLINTSLNVKGKPICGTPEMALDCLVVSGLDALMIENWWISK